MMSLLGDLVKQYTGEKVRHRPQLTYVPRQFDTLHADLKSSFLRCDRDAGTEAFLVSAASSSLWKEMALGLLRLCLSLTTANGLLNRGHMFVLSTEQTERLLAGLLPISPRGTASALTLLDIGAGDGHVTAQLAPLFGTVYATEFSATMRFRLRYRGYQVLPHDNPFFFPRQAMTPASRRYYDCIACMNVLDRADTPLTLLRQMRDSLTPAPPRDEGRNTCSDNGGGGGVLLLAVVLPWCPFVEDGAARRAPREGLPMEGGECCRGASYEASLNTLCQRVLQPLGFEVVRWTCVPYLCEGNQRNEYALLDDAVLVLRRRSGFDNARDDVVLPHHGYYSEGLSGTTG